MIYRFCKRWAIRSALRTGAYADHVRRCQPAGNVFPPWSPGREDADGHAVGAGAGTGGGLLRERVDGAPAMVACGQRLEGPGADVNATAADSRTGSPAPAPGLRRSIGASAVRDRPGTPRDAQG
ncbi:hypothetical protein GCM10010446_28990 [Streptomyces enissocaesilis]|uniref:Uncharacterized protein n=1 Tax=Streptomyces enissocaesilis TaxID=332589 RepID=A0ABN3X7Q3_9ACTN